MGKRIKVSKTSRGIKDQIRYLEKNIEYLRKQQKKVANKEKKDIAKTYVGDLRRNPTAAELKFMEIARLKHIELEFQHPIFIEYYGKIDRFYIADFFDKKHKIVIEIDGKYHKTPEQKEKDRLRTWTLRNRGYGVYRITNEQVMAGKSTAFLYAIYKRFGWTV